MKYFSNLLGLETALLPLSSVFIGLTLPFVDFVDYSLDFALVVLLMATAFFLQILSNISEKLGRFRHIADERGFGCAEEVCGFREKDCKAAFLSSLVLSVGFILASVYYAYGTFFSLDAFVFFLGGVLVLKTVSARASGSDFAVSGYYKDFHVFLFYGIIAVIGSYLMAVKTLSGWFILLPAAAMGFLSVSVFNIRNIYNMNRDRLDCSTVPVLWGEKCAKLYQTALVCLGLASMVVYSGFHAYSLSVFLYVLSLPLFVLGLYQTYRAGSGRHRFSVRLHVMAVILFSALAGYGLSAI